MIKIAAPERRAFDETHKVALAFRIQSIFPVQVMPLERGML
jgi:hypothetical protein